jgi:glycosyltransferase involved in cell wall biosynthesis
MSRRPIRVVFCLDSLGMGGTEMNAVRVAEHFDPREIQLSVACFRDDGPLCARFEAAGIPVDVFPVRSLYGYSMLREGRRFASFLRRERADVVHAHDRYANIFATTWARLAGTPAIIASKRWGSIGRAHGVGNRIAYRLAHRVLANSSAVGASLVVQDGVPQQKIIVIPNFVDDEAFCAPPESWRQALSAELSLPADALVVGIVANLRAIKDHHTLLDAVARLRARHPTLVLVIVGSGPEERALERQIAELGIASMVRIAGARPNLPNPHHLFDVSVLSSLSEGFPNSIVEAMAAGRPVVATKVGGVVDAVESGHTGLLVPPRDAPALAAAIDRLLGDADLRKTMGRAGQAIARSRFAASVVAPSVARLYASLLDHQSESTHA